MRVMVFCPTYRLEPETVAAVFALQWDGGIDFLFTRDNPLDGSDDGRANILYNYEKGREAFLQGGYDAMLVIESDIIPPVDALQKLAAVDADVAYGLYLFRRGDPPYAANVSRWVKGKNPDQPLNFFEADWRKSWGKVIRCSGSGLGCVLIRRHVLEAITFRGGKVHCDTYFTEDVFAAGYSMKADMSVICGHKRPDGMILWPEQGGGHREEVPSMTPMIEAVQLAQESQEMVPVRVKVAYAGGGMMYRPGDVMRVTVASARRMIARGRAEAI